jgi:hypothetical protein
MTRVILPADPLVLLLLVSLVVRQLNLISPYLVLMAFNLPVVLHPVTNYSKQDRRERCDVAT